MVGEQLTTSRMEAFSDGVIAVIITIMVLELKVPHADGLAGLRAVVPTLLVYLLSFVQVGIYWVNHHYLVDDVETVTHGMLWANLAFLFCLSLFPFATMWLGEHGIQPFPVALYAAVCALPALSWNVLAGIIKRRSGRPLAGSPRKQAVSSVLYLGAIPAAFLSPWLGLAMITVVAVLWLLPPQRVVEATRQASPHSR